MNDKLKKIAFASGYSESNIISKIIYSCNLEPIGDNKYPKKWIDEYGVSLNIKDFSMETLKKDFKSANLFSYRSPFSFLENSKTICIGLNPLNKTILSILCEDNCVRTWICTTGLIQRNSSLALGIDLLKEILDFDYSKIYKSDKKSLNYTNYDFYLFKNHNFEKFLLEKDCSNIASIIMI